MMNARRLTFVLIVVIRKLIPITVDHAVFVNILINIVLLLIIVLPFVFLLVCLPSLLVLGFVTLFFGSSSLIFFLVTTLFLTVRRLFLLLESLLFALPCFLMLLTFELLGLALRLTLLFALLDSRITTVVHGHVMTMRLVSTINRHIMRTVNCAGVLQRPMVFFFVITAVVVLTMLAMMKCIIEAVVVLCVLSMMKVAVPSITLVTMMTVMEILFVAMCVGVLIMNRLRLLMAIGIATMHGTEVLNTWLNTTIMAIVVLAHVMLIIQELCYRDVVFLLFQELGDRCVKEFRD